MGGRNAGGLSPEVVVHRVRRHERSLRAAHRLRSAAVLVPLLPRPDGLHVVLTLRPAHLPTHAGQVSFPGGTHEASDESRWATALREAEEEIALPPAAVERIGLLDDYTTITGYHVTPCVGMLSPDVSLRPCPHEVEEVFTVPLAHLLDPARRRTMRTRRSTGARRLYFYLTDHQVVWGATAAILTHFLDVVSGRAD
ncbi:MAG: CoA pyrophosphatase [Myxococcota bacterium]